MSYKYILFDADDTLLDFIEDEKQAFYETMEHYGVKVDENDRKRYSDINDGLWKDYEKGLIPKDDIRKLRYTNFFKEKGIDIDGVEADEVYRKNLALGGRTFPYAHELCRILCEKGKKLYVITNGYEQIQKSRFARSGLGTYIIRSFISETIGSRKPEKGFFDYVYGEIGAPDKSEILVVGDSISSDISGGEAYGFDTCWFNVRHKPNDTDVTPTYTVYRLEDIPAIAD